MAINIQITTNEGPTSSGDPLVIKGEAASNLKITNNTGESIQYSVDSGSSFTTLTNGSSANLGSGLPDEFRFRRVNSGAYPLSIDATLDVINSLDARFSFDHSNNTVLVGAGGTYDLSLIENRFGVSRGITLANCSSAAACTVTGAGVTLVDTAVNIPGYKTGTSLLWTIPAGVSSTLVFPVFTARNIKNGVFGIVFEQSSLDIARPAEFAVGDTSGFNVNSLKASPTMNKTEMQCWTFANSSTYSINEFSTVTGTPTPQTMTYARLIVNNTGGAVPWVGTIHEVFGAAATKPTVSFSFDDGTETDFYEALPVLNNYGFLASFSIIRDLVGDAGYVTETMLDRLYAEGHEICPHGQNTLTSFGTVALALADIDYNVEYLLARGYLRGSDYYVYPGGIWYYSASDRSSITNHLAARGMRAGYLYGATSGNASYGMLSFSGLMRYHLPRLPIKQPTAAATFLNQIDALVSTGRSVVLNLHKIVASGATGDETDRAIFEAICAGLYSRQNSGTLEVVPLSVAHDRLGL